MQDSAPGYLYQKGTLFYEIRLLYFFNSPPPRERHAFDLFFLLGTLFLCILRWSLIDGGCCTFNCPRFRFPYASPLQPVFIEKNQNEILRNNFAENGPDRSHDIFRVFFRVEQKGTERLLGNLCFFFFVFVFVFRCVFTKGIFVSFFLSFYYSSTLPYNFSAT